MMVEEWHDIPGYEGLYQVSNFGQVRSLDRLIFRENTTPYTWRGRVLRRATLATGYYAVSLCKHGNVKKRTVHDLVAEAFIGPRPSKYQINHKDGNKKNNRVYNLEYVTQQENIQHATENGLVAKGTRAGSRLIPNQIREIRRRYAAGGITQSELAAEFGVCQTTITAVVNRRTWTHI